MVEKLARFDFLAIPVVDEHNRLVGIVTHRDGEKVEPGQLFHHAVAGLLQADADRIALHQVRHERRRSGEDQVAERHEAHELAGGVEHVDVVDRLAVGRLGAEAGHGLARRDVGRQRRVFGRH
ncbi:MAG: CBS domain-containing protein [Planctomycetia bacterium]